jgi:hypothetical protein
VSESDESGVPQGAFQLKFSRKVGHLVMSLPIVVFSTSATTFQPHVVKKVCFSRAIFTDLNPKPIGSVFSKFGVVWTFYSTFLIFFGRFGNVWANSLARDV